MLNTKEQWKNRSSPQTGDCSQPTSELIRHGFLEEADIAFFKSGVPKLQDLMPDDLRWS